MSTSQTSNLKAKHSCQNHHAHHHSHEQRTSWVVYLAAVTMVFEIIVGYWSNSMALLADGWHMASHVLALGLTWVAYVLARKYEKSEKFSLNRDKLLGLSGFTSAVSLLVVALLMAVASVERFLNPLEIRFDEAIYVAIMGLVVNGLSAFLLHHDHNHDHNIRSAYMHVLADGLTSITAIITLLVGKFYNIYALDSVSGIISALVIGKWAVDLIRSSSKELVDFKIKV